MKIDIKLENCYGINKLGHSFEFGKKKFFVVYASNGMMKTSFAKTFRDLQSSVDSKDEIYEERITIREIKKDGQDLKAEEVLVIEPYQEKYQSSEIAKLLVNEELKKKYDEEHEELKNKKDEFLESMKKLSGLPSNEEIEQQVCDVFYQGEKDKFLPALERVEKEVKEEEHLYKEIKYSELFNSKTQQIIQDNDFIKNIESYTKQYEELLENSNFFRKGIFNHIQADKIAVELEKSGFFKAEHSLLLHSEEKIIANKKELEKVINKEKERILNDEKLKEEFEKLDKKLKKNQDLQKFREYLSSNSQVVSELKNPSAFKAKLWKCYFHEDLNNFEFLLEKYNKSKETLSTIRKQAQSESADWDKVINEFNGKFFVPFKLYVVNKINSVLDGENPKIGFKFDERDIEEDRLLRVLSRGEKRALYILNVLFEVEIRKKEQQHCLFVLDDIADSFDYKNKYSIIEYLNQISKIENFYLIILTHNFDFYRSVCSRLDMERPNKLHAKKSSSQITLVVEHYQNQPFKHWCENLDKDRFLLASIPMVRNLFEYSGATEDFKNLTNYIHFKKITPELKMHDLKEVYLKILQPKLVKKITNKSNYFKSLINFCNTNHDKDSLNLETKVILSMTIRLLAEKYMIGKIGKPMKINKNQTRALFDLYKSQFPKEREKIQLLEKINLMTPENIHLNSFMYEPILDMGDEELRKLYREISNVIDN